MLFQSFFFILLFLPLFLAGWFVCNHLRRYRLALGFLFGMSLWFYGCFSVFFVFLLCADILTVYAVSCGFARIDSAAAAFRASDVPRRLPVCRRLLLAAGVLLQLGFLLCFKYAGVFAAYAVPDTKAHGFLSSVVMPVGISFYTLQQLSFLIDRYRGEASHYGLLEYAAYVAYFPKLVQGPIAFHDEMIPQFRDLSRRRFDPVRFTRGIVLFTFGLSKKVLLADVLALPAAYGFAQAYYLDTLTVLLVVAAYALQIYFDFSGYCDMAGGIALMMNFTLPVNFNSPFKAVTVKDFWQRWHMTLSRFFVKYVYIPLGGSRKGAARTAGNVLLVFFLSGLWHDFGLTYICWALLQGVLVVFSDSGIVAVRGGRRHGLFRKEPLLTVPRFVGFLWTFLWFLLSLLFFGAQNMSYALALFRRLFVPLWPGFLFRVAATLDIAELYIIKQAVRLTMPQYVNLFFVAAFAVLLLLCALILKQPNARELAELIVPDKIQTLPRLRIRCGLIVLFVWSFLSLSRVSTFLYFQF